MFEKLQSNANSKSAAVLSALALAAAMAGESEAKMHGGVSADAVEQSEKSSVDRLALRKSVLERMNSGRLPNKVLDVYITFTTDGMQPWANLAPSGPPDTIWAPSHDPQYWIGTAPRYIHYNGDDWLILTNITADKGSVPVTRKINLTTFMNLEHLPKGAKIWANPNSPVDKVDAKLHPARINKFGEIIADGIPAGAPQRLGHFDEKSIVDGLISSTQLKPINPAKVRGLK